MCCAADNTPGTNPFGAPTCQGPAFMCDSGETLQYRGSYERNYPPYYVWEPNNGANALYGSCSDGK